MTGQPYRVAIFTTQSSVKGIIDILRDKAEVAAIIIPDNRKNAEKVHAVIDMCREYGLPFYWHPSRNNQSSFDEWLHSQKLNLAISWNYSQILTKNTLDAFSDGVWNMHGGKIPEYRGANVLQWCILNGEKEIGITWHEMNEEIDGGKILATSIIPISDQETALDVGKRVNEEAIKLFGKLWEDYCSGQLHFVPVDTEKGNYYPRRHAVDSLVPELCTKMQLRNYQRALCPPWPGPILYYQNQYYQISDSNQAETKIMYPCIDGPVELMVRKIVDQDFLEQLEAKRLNNKR